MLASPVVSTAMSTPSLAWLARSGRHVVDERGAPFFLRGVGLGNWLLPEGYMWLFGDECASPRQIEGLVARLIGDETLLLSGGASATPM